MDQAAIIKGVAAYLADEPRLVGLFLSGSYGRGEDDAYSDVDFVAVASPGHQEDLMEVWRAALESVACLIMWKRPFPKASLINAITEDWIRCDLYLIAPDAMGGRAKTTLKPLIDPTDIFASLPATLPNSQPNKERIAATINEFIRLIGMTPVVFGRGEWVTATQGAGMERDMLIALMLEEVTKPDKGGAMHLSKLLPPEDFTELMSLPAPAPDRASVLATFKAIASAFFPRAKRLAQELDIEWPDTFEAKTRANLRKTVGLEFD